jgi:hypothetical protein
MKIGYTVQLYIAHMIAARSNLRTATTCDAARPGLGNRFRYHCALISDTVSLLSDWPGPQNTRGYSRG